MSMDGQSVVALPERPRLLVVDDQPINIQVLFQIFGEDHEVFMATDGRQALEACESTDIDLILLDVVMPEMDGIEVCQRLKANERTRNIPVMFVTAQDSPDEETRGLDVGAVDFISKPVNPAVVRARVRNQLLLKAQADALRALAYMDGLTGVANRRYFDDQFDVEWRACKRNQQPVAVALMDIDHFKTYNDRYGHLQGDDCLKTVARALRDGMNRPRDLIARYGGEEFVCLLPETTLEGALEKAESLRAAVEALAIPHAHSSAAGVVTISIGVAACVPDQQEPGELLEAADKQLYTAKEQGRNQVCGAGDL